MSVVKNVKYQEAELLLKKLRSPDDINRLKQLLKAEPDNENYKAMLESQAYKARIDNIANLFGQLDSIILPMISEERKRQALLYEKLAEEAYYKSIFDIQQYAGYGFNFKVLDRKNIERVLSTRWSGKNFSQRIWENTNDLAEAVKEEVLLNLLTGRPLKKAQDSINDRFRTGASNARRLMRTESCYVCNQLHLKGYEACGVEKYIYLAILDLKTSQVCRSLDKKRFPVSEAQAGKNFPPMHPYCRSTTIADIPDELLKKLKQSAVDPATGERITVPGDMTYKEWYEKYVDKSGTKTGKSVAKSNNSDIINTRNLADRKMASGLRTSPSHILTDTEIKSIKNDAISIEMPEKILRFNEGNQTGFVDRTKSINVKGDILPDLTSKIPRDCMSQRAVLAHEYYGHYKSHPSQFRVGDWRDEFRASYKAAIDTPNLTDLERSMLMQDAYDRASEAGVKAIKNKEARRIIYGYDD